MVLIDKPMPESCAECFCDDDYYRCGLLNKGFPLEFDMESRMPDCPLKEADVIEVGKALSLEDIKVEMENDGEHIVITRRT